MGTSGLIVIGDEILTGKVQDANSPHVISLMREVGVDLKRIVVIPDQVDEIAEQVGDFASRYTYVITSGGIGPTHDDCTISGIARAFGRNVIRHPELETRIRDRLGDKTTAAALKMSEIPEGATLIGNKPYPTIVFENVFVLPGVPEIFARELRALSTQFVGTKVYGIRIYLTVGENQIAAALSQVDAQFLGVSIGSYPRFDETEHRVMVTVESRDEQALKQAHEAIRLLITEAVILRTESALAALLPPHDLGQEARILSHRTEPGACMATGEATRCPLRAAGGPFAWLLLQASGDTL